MKRKNIHQIASALFVLLAVACSKEEFADIPMDGEQQEIRFDIAMANATPSGPSTRVSTATDFTSTFTAGDKVGLYIVIGDDSELKSTGNWVENVPMTFDGTTWTCDLPEGKKCYPTDGSKLSFYAYYPYDSKVTDPLNMSFSVQANQSAGLSSSYLMTASKKGVSKSHNPVQLTFAHKLAMVKVNLINGQQAHNIAPGPADVVTLKGRWLTTSLNLATDDVGSSGPPTDVKMHYNTADKCWYALVPHQLVTTSSVQLTFEWTHILTLKHAPPKPFTLAKGEVKPLNITINANMTIDKNHVYAVGDAYPYVGFDKKGVVFEVSGGGKSGKILSRERVYGLTWSTESFLTNANNDNNGRVNMKTVLNHDNTFAQYPAFQWVHGLNSESTTYEADSKGIWYLPARYEITPMFAGENKEKVSRTLKALGMEDPLPENYGMWSSTEAYDGGYSEWRAYSISLWGGMDMTGPKTDGDRTYAWPIMAFGPE